jgi:hypothetical protein
LKEIWRESLAGVLKRRETLGLTDAQIGLGSTIYLLGAVLGALVFAMRRTAWDANAYRPYFLIGLQAMDGVAAAIYGVLLTLVTADLAKGTGRFNFLQGSIQSAMGLGAFLSNLAFGFVAKAMGFNAAFIGLSSFAVLGGLLYQLRMPETRASEQ